MFDSFLTEISDELKIFNEINVKRLNLELSNFDTVYSFINNNCDLETWEILKKNPKVD